MGVSWFEAMAYAAWLDRRLRDEGKLPHGYVVRLATEAEWEKAARSGDARRHPWGDADWSEDRANIRDSGIGHVTPVGMYPNGATLSGTQDLAGNVWEWTLSRDRDYPYRPDDGRNDADGEGTRVLRGGSWDNIQRIARCAIRDGSGPDLFGDGIGFRVVVSLADSGF